jgi:hypothetical protein
VVITIAPRVLTDDEEGVLGALLAVDVPGSKELRQQARHVRVVGRCDCGCATVDLEVLGGPAAPDADHQPGEASVSVRGAAVRSIATMTAVSPKCTGTGRNP